MGTFDDSVPLGLGVADLRMIRRVLNSYVDRGHSEQSATIDTIRGRISAVTMSQDSEQESKLFGLFSDELTIVDSALIAYVASIRQSIPPSEERDEMIRIHEVFRVRLLASSQIILPNECMHNVLDASM